jgi:hypothetical protein
VRNSVLATVHVERMRRNEREGGKGAARNTERRRKGDKMDERGVELPFLFSYVYVNTYC